MMQRVQIYGFNGIIYEVQSSEAPLGVGPGGGAGTGVEGSTQAGV
jgi:hypothetical protein